MKQLITVSKKYFFLPRNFHFLHLPREIEAIQENNALREDGDDILEKIWRQNRRKAIISSSLTYNLM